VDAERAEPNWKLVVDSLPSIVWMSGPDGSSEYSNRWGNDYAGLPPAGFTGWDWLALVHPEDIEIARTSWEKAIRSGEALKAEYRIRRSDGEFRWHAHQALPIRSADNQISMWIGTATDVEHLRRQERRLVEARAEASGFLLALQAAAPVGFGFVDCDLRIARLNEELAAVTGATPEALVGRTVAEVAPELWPQVEATFRQVLRTGETIRSVAVVGPSAKDPGRFHEWLASFYPVPVEGEIVGVGVVSIDITERVQAMEFRTAVMSQVSDGVYTQDTDGLFSYMNRAASAMLGWSEEELRGRRIHEVIHFQREDGTPVAADECALLTMGTQEPLVRAVGEAFTRKDGSIFPVAYSSAPLRIGPRVEGVAVVFRDISEPGLSHRPIRLLIVDSHAMISEAFELLMNAQEGVEVVGVAATSAIALSSASQLRPDVLLIDYELSDRDGLVTARLVRAALPEASVILMIGSYDSRIVAEAIDAGCAGVLDKDRAWVELVGAVRAAHRGDTVLSQAQLQRALPRLREGPLRGSRADLTKREREVLGYIAEGLSNRAVAERLNVTPNTIRNHVQRILSKLGVHSKLEAVVVATRDR
jgi:PAS domain S-box-containing protein